MVRQPPLTSTIPVSNGQNLGNPINNRLFPIDGKKQKYRLDDKAFQQPHSASSFPDSLETLP